jgi:hypothetical protein
MKTGGSRSPALTTGSMSARHQALEALIVDRRDPEAGMAAGAGRPARNTMDLIRGMRSGSRRRPAIAARDMTTRNIIRQYARRMTIEQRLAEIIRAFCADALSSTVNLNVDLDVVLCVLAQALLAALRARLPGYAAVTPDVIQRRFLETPGQIITDRSTITVRLERRAYSPALPKASLPPATPVPWWGGRTIRYEIT